MLNIRIEPGGWKREIKGGKTVLGAIHPYMLMIKNVN